MIFQKIFAVSGDANFWKDIKGFFNKLIEQKDFQEKFFIVFLGTFLAIFV
jgi:hypothetical protein